MGTFLPTFKYSKSSKIAESLGSVNCVYFSTQHFQHSQDAYLNLLLEVQDFIWSIYDSTVDRLLAKHYEVVEVFFLQKKKQKVLTVGRSCVEH